MQDLITLPKGKQKSRKQRVKSQTLREGLIWHGFQVMAIESR